MTITDLSTVFELQFITGASNKSEISMELT